MFEPPQRILVAAATLNTLPMDWRGNRERIISALGEARAQGAAFVVFPELSLSGYGCEDVFHSPAHSRAALESLRALLPETKGLAVVVGLPWRLEEGLYNTVAFLVDGKLVGVYAKQHLAGDGVHYEPRWFRPWAQGRVVEVSPFGEAVPFGEVVFDLGGVRIGAEICEDAWVLERPAFRYARVGNDITVCPTASHFAFGKSEVRKRIAQEGSRSCACAYLLANLVGNESGRMIFDGQRLIFGGGELLAESERFTFREQAITTATLNLEVLRAHRQRIFSLYSPDSSIRIHPVPFAWPKAQTGGVAHPLPRLLCKEEEFTKAESLALFDYLRKSRSRGFVVSLSGGADSAACSVLAAHALQLAKHELGEEGVAKKLPGLALDWSRFSVGLLDTVYQGTANSGPVTRHAARSLAEALQATHSEWDVEAFVALCRSNVEAHLGRPLNWQQDDLTLQNIQSRVRAPGVWMLANARGALLLATGNRSECAVGYATMDGDTAGSISPLAGIDKHWLRHWLRWMETVGLQEIGPIPALKHINDQQPTAELRPQENGQTDEADLMPYEVLDRIERLLVRDKCSPAQILEHLRSFYPERIYSNTQLETWLRRFIQLWSRNQWKRERYAPSFHLDDENLDPKTWCRFPILSSGFQEELEQLYTRSKSD